MRDQSLLSYVVKTNKISRLLFGGISIFFFCFILTSCGFQLRNYQPFPSYIKTISINYSRPYDPLVKQLTQLLANDHIQVLAAGNSNADLNIMIEQVNTSSSSIFESGSSDTEQYRMYYSVSYYLADKNKKAIWAPAPVQVSQLYSVNQNTVLNSSIVEESVTKQLQQQAAEAILLQINSKSAQAAIKNTFNNAANKNEAKN